MMRKLIFACLVIDGTTVLANEMATPTLQIERQSLPGKSSFRASAVKNGMLWVGGTGGKIFRSEDLGQHWQDISLPDFSEADIRDLEVFDANTAIVMTVGEAELSRLYFTDNAGKDWKLLLKNQEPRGFFDSIAFWDRNNGLLFGDPVEGYFVVLKTIDGGKTWRRIPKDKLPPKLDKESAFAASGNTLTVSTNHQAWIATGGFSASVYYSQNAGESWRRFEIPLYAATQTAGTYALALNYQHQVFALGGDYLQRDGQYQNMVMWNGQVGRWAPVNQSQMGLRTAMGCTQSLCISTGKLGMDYSTDQGIHWHHWSTDGYYTLASDGEFILAAGHDGRIGLIRN